MFYAAFQLSLRANNCDGEDFRARGNMIKSIIAVAARQNKKCLIREYISGNHGKNRERKMKAYLTLSKQLRLSQIISNNKSSIIKTWRILFKPLGYQSLIRLR